MKENGLPFKVGQFVESRSFQTGYRGAWFHCKIEKIFRRKNAMYYDLKYLDFPDERMHQTKLYQKHQVGNKKLREQMHLMVRPRFPTVYRENRVPDISDISEEVVVVDEWRVGDLIDWRYDDCYWSGKITGKLVDEKFQIELFPPPKGEGDGSTYEASCNEMRPSLDWSPENGWTVPVNEDGEKGRCCARLVKFVNQGKGVSANMTSKSVEEDEKGHQPKAAPSLEQQALFSSSILATPEKSPLKTDALRETHAPKRKVSSNSAESIPGSHVRGLSPDMTGVTDGKDKEDIGRASKKTKNDGGILLNSTISDSVEAAIMDLEELVNKIKWTKSLLDLGKSSSDTGKSWKFMEYRASSSRK